MLTDEAKRARGARGGVCALAAAAATLSWSGAGTWIALRATGLLVGLRVSRDEEREGLDVVLHGEQVS